MSKALLTKPMRAPNGDPLFFASLSRALQNADAGATVLYRKLEMAVRAALTDGLLGPGASLPGERELAEGLNLSRATVRKALDSLVAEGFLVRRHGARTAVAARIEKPLASLTSFSEDMRSRGLEPGVIWLHRSISEATPAEVMALHLSPGAAVCRLHRIRTGGNKPMAVERATVPSRFLPDPELVTASLYDVLETYGCRPVRALQRLRAAVATPEVAKLLDLEAGAPLLVAERRCFADDGSAVEFTETTYCGERYDFVAELRRTPRNTIQSHTS
jgi:GntR family transcriptional regulator